LIKIRTEEFLRGYDSCRGNLQDILSKDVRLQKHTKLMDLAQYPYYETDGKDWHPDCDNCKFRKQNIDYYYYCSKKVDINKIKEHCIEKK